MICVTEKLGSLYLLTYLSYLVKILFLFAVCNLKTSHKWSFDFILTDFIGQRKFR